MTPLPVPYIRLPRLAWASASALFSSKCVPLHRCLIILGNALSVFVHHRPSLVLGRGMPLFGSESVYHLAACLIILGNTLTVCCTSHPDCTGKRRTFVSAASFHQLHCCLIVLREHLVRALYITPQIELGHWPPPVRQQVCTTSQQSHNPGEHLVRWRYITPRMYWTVALPCFGGKLSTISQQSYRFVKHLVRGGTCIT
jgi:hypothetical protein